MEKVSKQNRSFEVRPFWPDLFVYDSEPNVLLGADGQDVAEYAGDITTTLESGQIATDLMHSDTDLCLP